MSATEPRRRWPRIPLPGPAGPGGLFGGALSFVQVMRELDLAEIQRQLTAPIRVLVTGSNQAEASQIAERLFGTVELSSWSVAVSSLDEGHLGEEHPDLAIMLVQPGESPLELLARYRRRPARRDVPVLGVLFGYPLASANPHASSAERPQVGNELRENESAQPRFRMVSVTSGEPTDLDEVVPAAALELCPDLSLALGRRFPLFKPLVAESLIRETSRVNAQFAIMSSLPANIPLVGGVASGVADLLFLTKNQGVLVYKLAGLYGRDLKDRVSLAVEVAPVVGGAFLWRSIARSLLGMLPTIAGAVPKAVVAYSGTYAVGQMARYYYSTGQGPSPELVARFQKEGARLAGEVLSRIREWRRPGARR